MSINPSTIQSLVENYGIAFENSYAGSERFRSSLEINDHWVIDDIIPNNLAKTIDSCNKQYYVGYNSRNELCFVMAPTNKPKVIGKNYLMCRLYGVYDHCIREASLREVLDSFDKIKSGYGGVIYEGGLDVMYGNPLYTRPNSKYKYSCFVESAVNCNWHSDRLITDTLMVEADGRFYFKNSSETMREVRSKFSSEVPNLDFGNSTFAKIINILTDEECMVRLS